MALAGALRHKAKFPLAAFDKRYLLDWSRNHLVQAKCGSFANIRENIARARKNHLSENKLQHQNSKGEARNTLLDAGEKICSNLAANKNEIFVRKVKGKASQGVLKTRTVENTIQGRARGIDRPPCPIDWMEAQADSVLDETPLLLYPIPTDKKVQLPNRSKSPWPRANNRTAKHNDVGLWLTYTDIPRAVAPNKTTKQRNVG